MPRAITSSEVKALISAGKLRDALALLNLSTEHRFTALYRFGGDTLHNLILVDRDDPTQTGMGDIPMLASYCVFIRDASRPFDTADSLEDPRVAEHPKRNQIRSYCGVPLMDATGRVYGSLCHFDYRPLPVRPDTIELLEDVAPALQGVQAMRPED